MKFSLDIDMVAPSELFHGLVSPAVSSLAPEMSEWSLRLSFPLALWVLAVFAPDSIVPPLVALLTRVWELSLLSFLLLVLPALVRFAGCLFFTMRSASSSISAPSSRRRPHLLLLLRHFRLLDLDLRFLPHFFPLRMRRRRRLRLRLFPLLRPRRLQLRRDRRRDLRFLPHFRRRERSPGDSTSSRGAQV